MKTYVFENQLNSNIKVLIDAYNYAQAMDMLLSTIRDIDDFRLAINND